MRSLRFQIAVNLFVAAAVAGCQSNRDPSTRSSRSSTRSSAATTRGLQAATRPHIDGNAALSLEDVEPNPVLAPMPSTIPTSEAPLDALVLFGRACDAMATDQRFTAINLLERAAKADPSSREIFRMLARAQIAGGNPGKAIDALNRAAEIQPDDLTTQLALGRLYANRKDYIAAIAHLRLALQTRGYRANEPDAATAEYQLARALQAQGYDRAAVEEYQTLLKRLASGAPAAPVRSEFGMNDPAIRPSAVVADVARLSEKLGLWEEARRAWKQLSQDEPDNFDAAARCAQVQLNLADRDGAIATAIDAVRHFEASAPAIDLLREVCRRTGSEADALDQMIELHRAEPRDRSITFALAELLSNSHRDEDATRVLQESIEASEYEPPLVEQLFRFYFDHHDPRRAGSLLIEAAARRPGDASQFYLWFSKLTASTREDSIRPSEILSWTISPAAEAARCYFIANVVLDLHTAGDRVLAAAIDRGVKFEPIFPPLFRTAIRRNGARMDLSREQKDQVAETLIETARERGAAGFADELRGLHLAQTLKKPGEAFENADASKVAAEQLKLAVENQARLNQAIESLDRALKSRSAIATTESGSTNSSSAAITAGPPPMDLLVECAELQRATSNPQRYEQLAWQIVSDYPSRDEGYSFLFAVYSDPNRAPSPTAPALGVLQKWLNAIPNSVAARVREAIALGNAGRGREAMELATRLLHENPDDADVLSASRTIFASAGATPQYEKLLKELIADRTDHLLAAEFLFENYFRSQQLDEARRLVDALRVACAAKPRLLYEVSELYSRLNQPEEAQATLAEIVNIAADEPRANNDLGYEMADEGKNIPRAEALIRHAVELEPENASYLDSLGWVLYKQGRFAEARPLLERAILGESGPESVVLDHLGDTLYQQGDRPAAIRRWKQSLVQLLGVRRTAEMMRVQAAVQQKLTAAAANQPVPVAATQPAMRPSTPPTPPSAEQPAGIE